MFLTIAILTNMQYFKRNEFMLHITLFIFTGLKLKIGLNK